MNGWMEALLTLAVLAGWAFVSSVAVDATERPAQAPSAAAVSVQARSGPPCAAVPSGQPVPAAARAPGAEACAVR